MSECPLSDYIIIINQHLITPTNTNCPQVNKEVEHHWLWEGCPEKISGEGVFVGSSPYSRSGEFYCISLAIKLFNYAMWVEPVQRQSRGDVIMKTSAGGVPSFFLFFFDRSAGRI